MSTAVLCLAILLAAAPFELLALDPHKTLTQYSRTVWTQEQGLPQDTIRAIAQTRDGYLWLGTDEGLARFDGYEFVRYTKDPHGLPGNSITALLASRDGGLWIGTSDGLTHYRDGAFTTYTKRDGLADDVVTALAEDAGGSIWIAAGVVLSRFEHGKFTNYSTAELRPIEAVRAVAADTKGTVWIAGYGGLVSFRGGHFTQALGPETFGSDIVTSLLADRHGNVWIGSSNGLRMRSPSGATRVFDARDGLPAPPVRALWEDRDGNLWAGTNGGLSRLENGRFAAPSLDAGRDRDWVRSLFEDREGNLWVGMNSGLNRFRDDRFTMYGRTEGLPSDEPLAVHQERAGQIWVGYHDSGLVAFSPGRYRVFTKANGLPGDEIFSIRESRDGGLLIGTREGLSRMRNGRFTNTVLADPLGRRLVFDALEDTRGRLWAATPSGVHELTANPSKSVVPGGALLNSSSIVLCEGRGGEIWDGTYGEGLWRIAGAETRLFTTADGLGGDQIRALYQDPGGTLWIGTFGGGLNAYRDGRFTRFTAGDGLLSDNVSHIEDDGAGSLWLSTTRGICRIAKSQLRDFAAHRISALTPVNYGRENGLRSSQCAPGYPAGAGGTRTADGRLWFPTSRGLAAIQPNRPEAPALAPIVHMVEVTVDGRDVNAAGPSKLPPGAGRIQFRYTGVYLSAPDRVRYAYKLEGLDRDWVRPVNRRVINYNSLPHGNYRFLVRASLDGGPFTETSFAFELLPHFYERPWFLWLCALAVLLAVYGVYQMRLGQIRGRFSLVLDERARLAREIHDTLAQGFVGISSQLGAVELKMQSDLDLARKHLETAQAMARHSLTEARRSVMDLRASVLEERDLSAALAAAARQWSAGAAVEVHMETSGENRKLPQDVEQQLLRIAQEAVANALKHASAREVWIRLTMEARRLLLCVEDNGRGFEPAAILSLAGTHFGLVGMRERAERLGGELRLSSEPGRGTHVEVSVPLP